MIEHIHIMLFDVWYLKRENEKQLILQCQVKLIETSESLALKEVIYMTSGWWWEQMFWGIGCRN